MAKKLAPKKANVKAKDNSDKDVKVSVEVDKRDASGTKTTENLKGVVVDNVEDLDPVNPIPDNKVVVGQSKGYTINLGGYESARINCWISKHTNDDEVSIMNTMAEISQLLDEQLEFEIEELNVDRN